MVGLGIGIGIGIGDSPVPVVKMNSEGNDILFQNPENLLFKNQSLWIPDFDTEIHEHIKKDPSILYQLSPRKFEELIASIFRNQGFNVELTPQSRDGGYDVLAVQKDSITADDRYLIECKRYAPDNKIGVGIIRSLLGVVVDQRGTKGILAITSFFTAPAKMIEERNQKLLELKDYNNLLKWLDNKAILYK